MTIAIVTGMGCVSAVGEGVEAFWNALLAGTTGIKEITEFSTEGLRNPRGGAVRLSENLRAFAVCEQVRARLLVFAFAAIDQALADASIDLTRLRASGRKVALIVGTSLGMSLVAPETVLEQLAEFEGDRSNADLRALGEAIERRYGLEGEVVVVTTACASSTHAIALACDMIRQDGYDLVIAGGADSLDRMKLLGHTALSTLTPDVPRPFSRARDGTLFGEGAGFLVLTPGEEGSPPRYAACVGAGFSTDVYHVTAPDPTGAGAAAAMRAALADANVEPDAVGHVNLHGSGTTLNDAVEFHALSQVFGARTASLPSTSIKAAIGHTMGAAGAIEAIATVLALRDEVAPPTAYVAADDVAFDLDLVTVSARRIGAMRFALSNSFGFGGANGALLFGR